MTAHPKICPTTGEMHFFGYGYVEPFLTYHVADATGRLVTSREVEVPGSTMMHDFNLTERFVVFMDLPVVFDLELAIAGTMPYRFDRSYGARLGVLRRDDPHGAVRWFDIETCYVFHAVNAYDDGTRPSPWMSSATPSCGRRRARCRRPTCGAGRSISPPDESPSASSTTGPASSLGSMTVSWAGRRTGRGCATMADRDDPRASGSITVYVQGGERSTTYDFGPGRVPGEAVFAPATDRAGGPGWLLTYVYDAASDRSEVVVLDADDVAAGPAATVHLPTAVPHGFHGSWLAEASPGARIGD